MSKSILSGLFVTLFASFAVVGCAAETSETAPDDVAADELQLAVPVLAGAYESTNSEGYPSIQSMFFHNDGTFAAEVDTGIRCFRAPCPSFQRIEGTFKNTAKTLTLRPASESVGIGNLAGRYALTVGKDGLAIRSYSTGPTAVSATLVSKVGSCGQPVDCYSQNLITPACWGIGFTCSPENTCQWHCGFLPPAIH